MTEFKPPVRTMSFILLQHFCRFSQTASGVPLLWHPCFDCYTTDLYFLQLASYLSNKWHTSYTKKDRNGYSEITLKLYWKLLTPVLIELTLIEVPLNFMMKTWSKFNMGTCLKTNRRFGDYCHQIQSPMIVLIQKDHGRYVVKIIN